MRINNIKKNFIILKQLTRNFPYTEFMFPLIPIFAILIQQNLIWSPRSLFLIFPFLLAHAAGYCYNHVCDSDIDSKDINPITRGDITKKQTLYITIILSLVAVTSFILLYSSIVGLALFFFYLLLWFMYSGLYTRFKKRYLGVFAAGFISCTSAPLIIVAEFNYFSWGIAYLIIGIFLAYTSREIHHTLIDYEADFREECNSFAVKVGKKTAVGTKFLFLGGGYLFMMASGIYIIGATFLPVIMLFILIFGVLHSLEFTCYKLNYCLRLLEEGRLAYYFIRIFLLIFSVYVLKFSILIIFLVVWAFITTKRY